MFTKVLYPTDFSECSMKVIPYINKLKDSGAKEVIIIHVIDSKEEELIKKMSWASKTVRDELLANFFQKQISETEKKVKPIKEQLKDFKITVRIVEGVPFKKIMEVAEEEDASIIALASHGISNIGEMVLGSVTELIVRKTPLPCIVVKR